MDLLLCLLLLLLKLLLDLLLVLLKNLLHASSYLGGMIRHAINLLSGVAQPVGQGDILWGGPAIYACSGA